MLYKWLHFAVGLVIKHSLLSIRCPSRLRSSWSLYMRSPCWMCSSWTQASTSIRNLWLLCWSCGSNSSLSGLTYSAAEPRWPRTCAAGECTAESGCVRRAGEWGRIQLLLKRQNVVPVSMPTTSMLVFTSNTSTEQCMRMAWNTEGTCEEKSWNYCA